MVMAKGKKRDPALLSSGPSLSNGCVYLDCCRRRDEPELAHELVLVVVDASLSDLAVLYAQQLDSMAGDFLVGRWNGAHRALKRGGVRTFHRHLLDDPGCAHDLAANDHLAVRKAFQPARRVSGRIG